jgi:hypothetical protein
MDRADSTRETRLVRVAGICGDTASAVAEAQTASGLGYHAGLLNLTAMRGADQAALIQHAQAVSEAIPVFGFYLQPAIGGMELPYAFWRRFCKIDNVVAIKVAAFNRYHTIDVVRAVVVSGRRDIALYTGNDDNILADLLTPYRLESKGRFVERRFVGGLLGHWAVWTQRATQLLSACQNAASGDEIPTDLLRIANEVTDMNAVLFDAAHGFAGCLPGIHEVLRRQGLLEGVWCLNENVTLSPGQAEELGRVCNAYPHLVDDAFVQEHRDEWLSG